MALPIGINRPLGPGYLEIRHDETTGQTLLWVMIPERRTTVVGPGGVPAEIVLPAEEHEIGLHMQGVMLITPDGRVAQVTTGGRLAVAARDEPKYRDSLGRELNCVVNATDYEVDGLEGGDLVEVTAENGTIYIGWQDTTADENKLITVEPGTTHRFTIPNNYVGYHYSTEDGAGVIGRHSLLLDEA